VCFIYIFTDLMIDSKIKDTKLQLLFVKGPLIKEHLQILTDIS